jgi:glycosyltransferase involved in cell wall biosynthesis
MFAWLGRRDPVHLTVIIATLNRRKTAGLLAERMRELFPALEIEVIVVAPITADLPAASELVRYVADDGRGVYAAYKAGLASARGEYIWFIGDDDYPLDAAKLIGATLLEGIADLLIAPVLFSSGRVYRPARTILLLHFLNWCQQGVIYRRRVLMRHTFYRRLTVQADQYVNILLRSDSTVKKHFLVEPICVFGVNGISGHVRDPGYRSVRLALAQRTLGKGGFFVFRLLSLLEPLIKRIVKIR